MKDEPLTDDPEINAIIAQLTDWEAELKASASLDAVAKRVNGTIPFVQTLALHRATAVRMALVADVDRAFLFEQVERLRTENAAMRPIVAAVAKKSTVYFDAVRGKRFCIHCGEGQTGGVEVHGGDFFEHAPDCPAVLAAQMMEGMKEWAAYKGLRKNVAQHMNIFVQRAVLYQWNVFRMGAGISN